MDTADKTLFNADQFVIRKTIQKRVVRSESDPYLGILLAKKKNMALYINKRYSNLMVKNEDGIITGSDAIKKLAQTLDKQSYDPKNMEKHKQQLEEELAEVRRRAKSLGKEPVKKIKKTRFKDQSQVLRSFIQEKIDPPKLDDLYKKYRLQKLKDIIKENKPPEGVVDAQQSEQLMQKISDIAEKNNQVEQISEVFVTRTLEDSTVDINRLLNLKEEIRKQAIPLKPPEEQIIDDIIRKHRDKKYRKIMLEQTEEKEVIRLFRFVENQTFKSSRLSDLEIRKIKETQEKFTAEDRQKEEVLMLADTKKRPNTNDTRFKRDNRKFDKFYRSDSDFYLAIASRELRKIKETTQESPTRFSRNASLSWNQSNLLAPLHKDQTMSQVNLQNASQTSLRPATSMTSTQCSLIESLGRRISHKESLELAKKTQNNNKMGETSTSKFRITNDNFLQTLDSQKFKRSLEDNYQRAMVARLASRNGNSRSLITTRQLSTDVSSTTGLESDILGTQRTKNRTQIEEHNDNEIAALRSEGREICYWSDELVKDALKNKRQLSRGLDKLEKKGNEGYKAINNPYLGKQETGPREFVELVNRTNFKRMIVNKMLIQIANKADVLKEFQQHEAKTLMASKLSKAFSKAPEVSTRKSSSVDREEFTTLPRNQITRETLFDGKENEDSKGKESDSGNGCELVFGGPPVEAWAHALNLYSLIDKYSSGAKKVVIRRMRVYETRLTNETDPQERIGTFQKLVTENKEQLASKENAATENDEVLRDISEESNKSNVIHEKTNEENDELQKNDEAPHPETDEKPDEGITNLE